MRIAYVSTDPGVPPFGHKGASVHVQAVLRALVGRGHEVHLVTAGRVAPTAPGLEAVRVHPLPRRRCADPAESEQLRRDVDALAEPVLDHLHDERPLDLVYERYSLWGRTAMRWAQRQAVAGALEVNAPLVEEQARHRVLVDRDGAEAVARLCIGAARTVLCVSEPLAVWARDRGGSDVHVVANGVDTMRVTPSAADVTAPAAESFTVGFVGTLKPWHGVELLAEAFGLLSAVDPTYRLLVVGDGPSAAALRHVLAEQGVMQAVEMTGAVDPAVVPSLLRGMDVATAPYPPLPDFYFSPLKIYEYLAAGLPIVASRVGAVPEVLEHGRLGELVEPGDPQALAHAVAALRASPQRREHLRRAGRAAAVARHDWTRVVDRALDLAGLPTGPVRTPLPTEVHDAVAG